MSKTDLYNSIVEHRKHFSKLGGVDYTTHFPPNLNPFPPDNLLVDWEKDYQKMQREMIYGASLFFSDLLIELKRIVKEINEMVI